MGSLFKNYSEKKLLGKTYTPNFLVEKILDDVNFKNENVENKTILDPACGDGRFLIPVAERIIKYSKPENLKNNLEKIYGWDIDKNAVKQCIANLNDLIKNYNFKINWNVKVLNALEQLPKYDLFNQNNEIQKFDFILTNPPFINARNLDLKQLEYIKQNYTFCKYGITDIYIAFFELAYNLLSDNGICGIITPNSYFYTASSKILREHLIKNKCIKQITNYAEIQLFENVSVCSAVTIFSKQKNDSFLYQRAINLNLFEEKNINFNELKNEKFWQLTTKEITNIENFKNNGKKLKEICKIYAGISTGLNEAYIFEIEPIDDNYVYAFTKLKGKVKIERNILKPIVRASKLKNSEQPIKEYIIFPFNKVNNKYEIIKEKELKEIYPFAYDYLISIKNELAKRDKGKPIYPFYNYSRLQNLNTIFGKKIIFSKINKNPNFILYENEDCLVYSGYFIKYNGDMKYLLEQLNSERMKKFIEISSRDYRSGYKAYNKRVLEEFVIY